MPATASRSFTARLRPDVYEAATALAKRQNVSLNALVQDSLAQAIRDAEDREMYEAAELLGHHPDDCNIEYAFAAQAEVALKVIYGTE
jgi:hypothetical protein